MENGEIAPSTPTETTKVNGDTLRLKNGMHLRPLVASHASFSTHFKSLIIPFDAILRQSHKIV